MSATNVDARTRRSVTIILLVASFISLASQTMMVTALPVIKNDLHVSLNAAQWLTTGYTLLIGVITPLSSNIYERFTNRSVFLSTVGTFIIGTLIGCFANNFWLLLLARLVQACAGGILMTFQMTTMITIYPPEKRGSVLGMSGLVIASGPALGPSLSGLILEYFSWRYIFIFVLPLMLLASVPLVRINAQMPIWVLTVAYMLRLIGNAFLFNPALSEAFSQLSPQENSHGTALNNTLRQACGAASVTLLVVISGLPASLTTGVQSAMWVTVALAVLMLVIFYRYLGWKKRQLG